MSPRLPALAAAAFALLLPVVVASVVVAPEARAEDAAAEPAEAEHSQHDVRLSADGLPEGWKLVGSAEAAPDEAALKDAIVAVVASKAKAEQVHVLGASATSPDGKKAVFALVDLDAVLPEAVAALKGAAEGKGWAVVAMGHATRWLVVAAPAEVRAKAVEVQVAYATRMLGLRATSALGAGNGARAVALARAILAMDAKHAVGNYVLGAAASAEANELRMREADDAAAVLGKAIAYMKAAVAKDATGSLTAGERAACLGELGLALLFTKKADAEARDFLKEAVAGTFDEPRSATIARYNLACAHGRLKELDEAFAALTASLEADTKAGDGAGIARIWRADEDLVSLKQDPRWAELEKKFPAPAGSGDN